MAHCRGMRRRRRHRRRHRRRRTSASGQCDRGRVSSALGWRQRPSPRCRQEAACGRRDGVGRDTRVAAALLLRGARSAALWPAHPPSLHPARGDVVCRVGGASRSVHKREIRWRDFCPHHLSRVNKKQSPHAVSRSFIWCSCSFLCAKNACEAKTRTLAPRKSIPLNTTRAGTRCVGKGGHSPDFSRLVSPKGAHCESS